MTRIIDGDTVEVDQTATSSSLKVRLYAIDAPKMDQTGGQDAAAKLQALLNEHNNGVMLETMAFDEYGRAVGLLYRRNYGRLQSVNLRMVHSGHALSSRCSRANPRLERMGFYSAEYNARKHHRGIWAAGSNPDQPWTNRWTTHAGDGLPQKLSLTGTFAPIRLAKRQLLKSRWSLAIASVFAYLLIMLTLAVT